MVIAGELGKRVRQIVAQEQPELDQVGREIRVVASTLRDGALNALLGACWPLPLDVEDAVLFEDLVELDEELLQLVDRDLGQVGEAQNARPQSHHHLGNAARVRPLDQILLTFAQQFDSAFHCAGQVLIDAA